MRAEIIEVIKSVALNYVHFEPGPPLLKLMQDILQSRNWKQAFGVSLPQQPTLCSNEFLQTLAKEYNNCKDKETKKTSKGKCKSTETKTVDWQYQGEEQTCNGWRYTLGHELTS